MLGRKPKRVNFNWGWEPLGHANPKDYANSVKTLLEIGLTSEVRELCKMGIKPEQILEDRQMWETLKTNYGLAVEEVSPGGNEVARAQFEIIREEMGDMRRMFSEALSQ